MQDAIQVLGLTILTLKGDQINFNDTQFMLNFVFRTIIIVIKFRNSKMTVRDAQLAFWGIFHGKDVRRIFLGCSGSVPGSFV